MNGMLKSSVLAILLVGTLPGAAHAQTTILQGETSGVWTLQGSPYLIEGDIVVPADCSLVIEPGVSVEFQGHYELLVNGSLRAIGTQTDTIRFTVSDTTGWSDPDTTRGGWKHIRLFAPASTNDSTVLEYCRIERGKAIGPTWPFNHGGAISVVEFDKVRIAHCLIVNNRSGGEGGPAGGAIGVSNCDIAIVGNTIAYNQSETGGGMHLSQSNSVLRGNTIRGNVASGYGGGVGILGDAARPSVVVFLSDSLVDNSGGVGGGAMHAVDVDSLVLDSVVIRANRAPWGAGVGAFNSSLHLGHCTLAFNTSGWLGGGLAADYCALDIRWSLFRQNVSLDGAGAMHCDHCVVTMANTSISANTSGTDTLAGNGGGIGFFASTVDIENSDFAQNVTDGSGGALWVDSTRLGMRGTILTDNRARLEGGGLCSFRSTLDFDDVWIRQNVVGNDSAAGIGGGIRSAEGTLILRGSVVDSNHATGGGGGIASYRGNLLLTGSAVSRNHAVWSGGGIDASEGALSIEDSEVSGNVAGNDTTFGAGGGIRTWGGSVLIRGSQIDSNLATGGGGGISASSDDYILDESSVSGNRSLGSGGGVQASQTKIFATALELVGNVAGSDTLAANGGGMEAGWSDVDLEGCTIRSNTASDGGGIILFNSDLTVYQGLFEVNTARVNQGALGFRVDTTFQGRPFECRILQTVFQSNTAANDVGGLRIDQSATDSNQVAVTIDACEFLNNQSRVNTALRIAGLAEGIVLSNSVFRGNISARQSAGGGISRGQGVVSNCLFADNAAGFELDQVFTASFSAIQGARVDLINCTFTRNRSAAASVLGMRTGAQVWLTNCIAYDNEGGPINLVTGNWETGCDLWVNHSLVEGGADSVAVQDSLCFLHWGAGNLDEDPLFRDPAADDFHLTEESPCIGAGVDSLEVDGHWLWAPATDLDGNPRPAPAGTRPDMGAYEDGVKIPVQVETESSSDLPVVYALYQNYPNPFNPATTIRFDLPEPARVRLEVFDLLGARVALLIDEEKEAGRWSVSFSNPSLASGVYVYRLKAGTRVFVETMILVR